ncbi:MauE/DoxX family redox-associated membrane protein [Dyadobacter psychrotolerans]|uniref:Methylamine utilisation protein MauE domain-containing protein n=1 Tax=Dyadobacter psychrotolerans TaxID=2541721 RepID=A0A4R5DZC9_9BACT|nr:MauE/DoxX family redox-associated membrane protein [Dyadobacter psychrotolerans]TDE18054.1 hypothetical protein E0F88_00425 [Dyadobacter psychrotolerans]
MKKNAPGILAALLVFLFFYTAVAKLSNLERFEAELLNQTIPKWSVPMLLWLLPVSELLAVALLVRAPTRLAGFYGSAALMLVFTLYMGLVLLDIFDREPCSCGGVLKSMGFEVHFIFNLLFLLLSITGIHLLKSENRRQVTDGKI